MAYSKKVRAPLLIDAGKVNESLTDQNRPTTCKKDFPTRLYRALEEDSH